MEPHITIIHDVDGETTALYLDGKLYRATDDTYLIWEDVCGLLGIPVFWRDLWMGQERKDWDGVAQNVEDVL